MSVISYELPQKKSADTIRTRNEEPTSPSSSRISSVSTLVPAESKTEEWTRDELVISLSESLAPIVQDYKTSMRNKSASPSDLRTRTIGSPTNSSLMSPSQQGLRMYVLTLLLIVSIAGGFKVLCHHHRKLQAMPSM